MGYSIFLLFLEVSYIELHREEKREEEDRGEQEEKSGNQKERERSRQCSVP